MTRKEAIKVLEMFLHKQCDLKRTEFAYDANTVWGAVKMASEALEQEPKTGHWIVKEGREQGYDIAGIKTWYIQIMCDKCGFIKTAIEGHTGQYHFCPNCGARMKSEDKE